jgi:hypothetical protein
MKKHFLLASFMLAFALLVASCSDSTTNPTDTTVAAKGSISVTTFPLSAAVSVDGSTTTFAAPHQFDSLTAGTHVVKVSFKVIRYSYLDTIKVSYTDSVTVQSGVVTSRSYSAYTLQNLYSDRKIYETNDPSLSDPSGLILSSGTTTSFSSGTSNAMDLYFRSTDSLISAINSSKAGIIRETYFYPSGSKSFDDETMNPPLYTLTDTKWKEGMPYNDTTQFYWLFDDDGNFSKAKITATGKNTSNYTWVTLTWKYYKHK